MIRKLKISMFLLLVLINYASKADEGMWLLNLLNKNYEEMKKAGFKLTTEDIYSLNNPSMKDAIVHFGAGCTGSIISADGLVLTNHHCGYPFIQANSTLEHNYLEEGFWATRPKEELPNEGLTARFLIKIEDVTAKVLAEVTDGMSGKERKTKITEAGNKLVAEATNGNNYNAIVKPIYEGNNYYLVVYIVYTDVRLVGAPPSSIGKFGGDTDNWMWPRHTADFSIFRVYTAKDGSPADYSPDNIAFKPKKFFPINIGGIKKDDFAMTLGYPGSTNRFLPSMGVKQAIDVINPSIVKIRDVKLTILREYMDQSNALRIKYSTKYARTSNYWKFFIGQTKGLNRLDVYGKKKALEDEFQKWGSENDQKKGLYGNVINDIEIAYKDMEQYNLVNIYFREAIMRGPDLFGYAHSFAKLYDILKKEAEMDKPDNVFLSKKMEIISDLKKEAEVFYRDYWKETEQKLFESLLSLFYKDIKKEFHPTIFQEIEKKYKGNFNDYTKNVFKKSFFADHDKLIEFLANPSLKKMDKDPLLSIVNSFIENETKMQDAQAGNFEKLEKANRLFVDGLLKMNSNTNYYPNANQTMRLSYGKINDYIPRDAVSFSYFTTLKGVIEKDDDTNDDFNVNPKLKELYSKKDYGRYGQNGELWVCFTTNNDITGGSSGSPVINGNGEIIGLAFDGNWEAMSGDIAFEPELQRCIASDIRYVLFIIDKFANAQYIMKELQIK